jgi:AcrR family transcriptional regulator
MNKTDDQIARMPEAGRRRRSGAVARTREAMLDAALETLHAEGYAGCSARVIARTGGFNPALIFYHYGGVTELLLAALDRSSAERMARYREALAPVSTLPELVEAVSRLYAEDMGTPHIAAVQELISSSAFSTEWAQQLVRRLEPWVDLAAEVLERVLGPSVLGDVVDTRDLAFAMVALYCGMETVSRLEGDSSRVGALFATVGRLAPALAQMLGASGAAPRSPRLRPASVPIT